jgi:hypothetical protein
MKLLDILESYFPFSHFNPSRNQGPVEFHFGAGMVVA